MNNAIGSFDNFSFREESDSADADNESSGSEELNFTGRKLAHAHVIQRNGKRGHLTSSSIKIPSMRRHTAGGMSCSTLLIGM